jgi:hypothetical protein
MLLIKGNQNIEESSLFFLSARSALTEVVKYKKQSLTEAAEKYLTNEASDFQVLSLLLLGKLPPVKYSPVAEAALLSVFKEKLLRNFNQYASIIGESTLLSFIHEVDCLYPRLSTQKPVLEFYQSISERIDDDTPISLPGMNRSQNLSGLSGEAELSASETLASGPGILAKLKTLISAAGEKWGEWTKAFVDFAKTEAGMGTGVVVGGAALAALMIYGAYKVYKNFMSKAAQACAGKKGAEKDACMNAYRKRAASAQMQTLNKVKVACKKAKDPAKCNAIVANKMQKIRAKIGR